MFNTLIDGYGWVFLPHKINRLDNKPQSRTDGRDIFVHDLFYDGGFARVVEAPGVLLADC